MKTLADELMEQITRVRDEVLPAYLEIGDPGRFAAAMMREDMDAATKALAHGDAIECLKRWESLKGWTT